MWGKRWRGGTLAQEAERNIYNYIVILFSSDTVTRLFCGPYVLAHCTLHKNIWIYYVLYYENNDYNDNDTFG